MQNNIFKIYWHKESNNIYIFFPPDWPYFVTVLPIDKKNNVGLLNAMFQEIIWCAVLVSQEIEAHNLIQPFLLVSEQPHWYLNFKGSIFYTKKYKMLFCKKREESVLNYKAIFLRSKDVLLSVVIINLKWYLSVAS